MMNLISVLLLASIINVNAKLDGAPPSCCTTMIPSHGVDPQTTFSPFVTTPVKTIIAHDETLQLQLVSTNPDMSFKGYLLVAHMRGMEHNVGTFKTPSDGKIIDCENSSASSGVTHVLNTEKKLVTANWYPNGYTGDVIFKTSYVMNGSVFWVKQESIVVQVLPDPAAATTAKPDSGAMSSFSINAGGLVIIMIFSLLLNNVQSI